MLAQPQRTNTPQAETKAPSLLQHRNMNQSESSTFQSWWLDTASGTLAEPRFSYDFSRVPALSGMVQLTRPLLRTQPGIQRFPKNGETSTVPCPTCSEGESPELFAAAGLTKEKSEPGPEAVPTPQKPEPTTKETLLEETPAQGLIVEDSAQTVGPKQMRKSEFLAQLHAEVCRAVEGTLASMGQTTDGCPYLNYWFDFYNRKNSDHIERAIRRYAPETSSAITAEEYISIIAQRARQAADAWVRTGEVRGVPEGIPITLPGKAQSENGRSAAGAPGPVMFKNRRGTTPTVDDPQAIQAQLGEGSPLDSPVRSRMESAFGMDFAHVRTHTDSTAANLSDRLNARAFTVGEHIAFGPGEYHPGTLVGDALIAHEMAHVLQQRGADASFAPAQTGDTSYNMLENDADQSAMVAVVSLWNGAKGFFADTAQKTVPCLRSGLRLSRCKDESKQKAAIQVRTSGTTSPGNKRHFYAAEGGDKLGALTDEDDGITTAEATGKVEIVATLASNGANTGWDIKREIVFKDFSNGAISDSSSGRDDTSYASWKDLVPDADRKIYDIDNPTCGNKFAVDHTKETYNNFKQWVTLNGKRASDEVKWHYQARVDDDLDAANKPKNDDTELNDVGTGHITIPSKAHYKVR